jgi:hypothetical protein
MKTIVSWFVLSLIILGPGFTGTVHAESAISCHCFKDRSFNPADTFASDDYILATTFNSLIAAHFNIPKRKIIMVKMNDGVSQDDLLLGLKFSRLTGVDLRKYLRFRKENKTWADIYSSLKDNNKKIRDDKLLQKAAKPGMSLTEAGSMVADEVVSKFFAVPHENINSLRKTGLNEREMALVLILAHLRDVKPANLVELSRKKGKSWSEIAHNLGIEPAVAGKYVLAYPDKKIQE